MENQIPLLRNTSSDFANAIDSRLHKGSHHALLLYSHWMRKGEITNDFEVQAKGLVDQIVGMTDFSLPEISHMIDEGTTKKYLLRFHDGLESESVLIPMKTMNTLCVSSQIGCKRGCAFCETGKMGLVRNLKAQEIVAQVFYAIHVLKHEVRNLVFMGMGEPLDNFDEVLLAIRILTDPLGFHFGPGRITVSTSGVVDHIYRLLEPEFPKVNLAVSVNGSNDQIRSSLMPVNHRWNMAALKEAMVAYALKTKKKILIEYVLIKDRTDSVESAVELADYLQGLDVTVNLIPYNSQRKDRFQRASDEKIKAFREVMQQRGYFTTLRISKGQQIAAACGQLGNKKRLPITMI